MKKMSLQQVRQQEKMVMDISTPSPTVEIISTRIIWKSEAWSCDRCGRTLQGKSKMSRHFKSEKCQKDFLTGKNYYACNYL